jgi:hypothetical protein
MQHNSTVTAFSFQMTSTQGTHPFQKAGPYQFWRFHAIFKLFEKCPANKKDEVNSIKKFNTFPVDPLQGT